MQTYHHSALADYGLHNDDIKYLHVNTVINGRGPDRLKYLDIEGRWHLNGRSIPYISAMFNHLQTLNDAQVPFRDIIEEPLNAIGLIRWQGSEAPPVKAEEKPKPVKARKPFKVKKPVEIPEEELDEGPFGPLPHRTVGYGPDAHGKRKLQVTIRSRSTSPRSLSPSSDRAWSPPPRDLGYGSGASSGAPSPMQKPYAFEDEEDLFRPPHRTPSLSPIQRMKKGTTSENQAPNKQKTDKDPTKSVRYETDLKVIVSDDRSPQPPHRSFGYGEPHLPRQYYGISPRSITSISGTNSSSPSPRSADDHLLMSYHHANRGTIYPPSRRQIHDKEWVKRSVSVPSQKSC